jgi:ABC-2 type transport system ATP-binding protein
MSEDAMPSAAGPAIEARMLTKRYRRDRPPALDGIDLAVPAGSFAALVGPNGAGKSTLIRCCMGFERPTSGSVRVMGIDSQRDRSSALLRIGYVGQHPGLYRELSVIDHLALAASLRRGFDVAGSRQRLDDLGIDPTARAGHLSGGQQAQVALALALGTRAPVLLLDEPLASLDPLARRDFMRAVAVAVRSEGTTVLVASHIVGDLAGVCDRLIILAPAHVMYDGEIEDARRHHAMVPADDAGGADVVGTFGDERGNLQSLVRSAEPVADPASLDDIVLGYLSASRSKASHAAA